MNAAPLAPGLGRRVVASLWTAVLMPYLTLTLIVPVARALGAFASVPVSAIAVLSALAGPALVFARPRLAAPLPASLDTWLDRDHRKLAALWAVGGLLTLFVLVRMSIFLGDPSRFDLSLDPKNIFFSRHSCLTAYMHGAILSKDPAANVYDLLYVESVSDTPPPLPPTAAHFAPFTLDAYGYPPPFLLLPRALLLLTTDFFSQRLLCSAASLALFFFACAVVAKTLGGAAERRIWLLTPLFAGLPLMVILIQVGNFHLATVALCLLVWVALERDRDGIGGTLLAVATLSKIFPGLLGVILLVQKRWRAVALTCVAAIVICALSAAVVGTKVWHDFLFYHLPNVQSGEALAFMAKSRREIEFNIAPFGIPFKLRALGIAGMDWPQARLIGNVFTLLVLVIAALAGRTKGSPEHRLVTWLAIVMLGSLRSPYAAPFILATALALLMVLAAEVSSARGAALYVFAFLWIALPIPIADPTASMILWLMRQIGEYIFFVWAALRRPQLIEAPRTPGPARTPAQ